MVWRKAAGKLIIIHEGRVVSCPFSPDTAEEMRATGITIMIDPLLEVPTAKDRKSPQRC